MNEKASGRPSPLGVFDAVSTRDHQARLRKGHPYFAINQVAVDPQGRTSYEVCFGDGTWMLAVAADLAPIDDRALPESAQVP